MKLTINDGVIEKDGKRYALSAALELRELAAEQPAPEPAPPSPVEDPVDPEPAPPAIPGDEDDAPAVPLLVMRAAANDLVVEDIYATESGPVPVADGLTVYRARTVQTGPIGSFLGAATGPHPEIMEPVQATEAGEFYLVEFAPRGEPEAAPRNALLKVGGIPIQLTWLPWKLAPFYPAYMELQSFEVATTELGDPNANVRLQAPHILAAVNRMRGHFGVEPIKHAVAAPWLQSLDTFGEYGVSYRQLVLDGALHAPFLFGPTPRIQPPEAFLRSIEAMHVEGKLRPGSLGFVWDEGGDDLNTSLALERGRYIRQHAPTLPLLFTRRPDQRFIDLGGPIEFGPVLDLYPEGLKARLAYTSNMAQGNTTPVTDPAKLRPPSGTPMMCIDAPMPHPYMLAPVCHRVGAGAAYYYNTTQRSRRYKAEGDSALYAFGGWGDGTHYYYGNRWSLRMHLFAAGLRFVWALRQFGSPQRVAEFEALVKGPRDWTEELSAMQALRERIIDDALAAWTVRNAP